MTRSMQKTRPRKRQKLSGSHQTQDPQPRRPKRRRSHEADGEIAPNTATLSASRKRRHSEAENQCVKQPHKRVRITDAPDVEMADQPSSSAPRPSSTRRRRKTRLRDVLLAERVRLSTLDGLRVRPAAHANDGGETLCADGTESVTGLTGDEEVYETIDASENTDPNRGGDAQSAYSERAPGTVPSVQAVLLEDGLCAVRIVRADGTMQTVVIQPPDIQRENESW